MYCDASHQIAGGSRRRSPPSLVLSFGNQISATDFPQCRCLTPIKLPRLLGLLHRDWFHAVSAYSETQEKYGKKKKKTEQLKPLPGASIVDVGVQFEFGDRISKTCGAKGERQIGSALNHFCNPLKLTVLVLQQGVLDLQGFYCGAEVDKSKASGADTLLGFYWIW
ncbi:uncharacterized protein LOC116023788 [Ipomoea triloba]|uniref:uncharacterized protein LOC116023788 n=1 Tax=Ipomoea triloba TaxID=35885 RepID=UPI00125E263C|nr:uncharacterized protein LOC116023788 [Ipomoea triloba]